jgi:hypothetical protein
MAQVGDKQEAWSSKFSIATLPQILESDVVVHTCNPSTWEAKTEGLWVQGQPMLHSETLKSLKKKKKIVIKVK